MLFQTLLSQLAPHDCIGCGAEGALICKGCQTSVVALPERCYRCQRVSAGSLTCVPCRATSDLYRVQARTVYKGLAKDLVWQLKFSGAQAAAREMAVMMRDLTLTDEAIVFIPVPTATGRARMRGYDQAVLLAKALAKASGQRYSPHLRRLGQHHQVGATRTQRIAQQQEAYRVVRTEGVKGTHVILVDDVLTTGSTMEAAAKVIKAAGAKRVSALVFAQA